jgi:multiple sugar transport system substrate-binding protein
MARLGSRMLAAAVCVAMLVVAACSSGKSSSGGGKQEITFLTHWSPPQVKMLQDAAAAYSKAHPDVKITFRAVPFADLLSTLRTQGSGPNGPTMASIYDLWLPELVKDGLVAPASAAATSDVQAHWPANLTADVTKGGQVFGFPNEVDLYALNYNKALFAQAGISGPPQTWAELTADAEKISKLGNGTQGFGVITSWDSGVVHPWLSLVNANGGTLLTGQQANLTDPKVQAATTLYKTLIDAKATNPSMSLANANTTGPFLDNFANGKTGMIIMANWWKAALQQSMGSKFSDVGTAPVPVGPDGSKSSAVAYSWLTVVNRHASAAKQAAAWGFLTWLNGPDSGKSGSSAMGDILMSMGILPSRSSDVTAHQSQLSDPFLKTYVDQLPNATPFPKVMGGAELTVAIQHQLEAVIFGRSSPQAAMSAAESEVNKILAQGG